MVTKYDVLLQNRELKILELFYSENLTAKQVVNKYNLDTHQNMTVSRAYQIRDIAARKIAKAIFSKTI